MNRRRWHIAVGLVLVLAMCAAGAGAGTLRRPDTGSPSRALAEQIYRTTGVKGGLVVHVGCGNGELTAALGAREGCVVHGLDSDPGSVARARKRIRGLGLYGEVSVEQWTGGGLPYVDNVVRLLVAKEQQSIPPQEVLRVLSPGGVAYVRNSGEWTKTVKPLPAGLDDWSHACYDASGNAVSQDSVVAPPYHLQWVAGPLNARSHDHASVSAVVSAAGRLFYIVDEAPAASCDLPSQWCLLARDAFSGVQLWRRPIREWQPHPGGLYASRPDISRRLVAWGDRVYVTLGAGAPVTALDAATGEVVKTYKGTAGTGEILYNAGRLCLAATGPAPRRGARDELVAPPGVGVMAVDAGTGTVVWNRPGARALPATLAVSCGRVFYVGVEEVHCLDALSGREQWRTEHAGPRARMLRTAPTVVACERVVLVADRSRAPVPDTDRATGKPVPKWLAATAAVGVLTAYAADTGEALWSCECAEGYFSPVDVFVNNGLVWVGQSLARRGPDFTEGRDLLTGEVKHRIDTAAAFNETTMPHHRCHRDRATSRYLVTGRTGVEFIDFATGKSSRHHWARGVCRFGTLPCNGLLYLPPHSCACFLKAKLTGFNALAPASPTRAPPDPVPEEGRLEHGPAYGEATLRISAEKGVGDWPTFRHDPARSGGTDSAVPTRLGGGWQRRVGGRLTSPVIAAGRVFLAAVDRHTVHAFDAAQGRELWQFTAGGRIDSPPTISDGLAVFGSADGRVYCLRADDGRLVWRRRMAPIDQRLVAFGQLESVWPVHGSVLVQDGVVTCAAGRSSYLDSGIYLSRLDLRTGRSLTERRLRSRDSGSGKQPREPGMFDMPGALPDILSSDGDRVFMRHLCLDANDLRSRNAVSHLYSPAGFLNDDWWDRTYWIFGDHFFSGSPMWHVAHLERPAGRLLVFDESTVYGFARHPSCSWWRSRAQPYHLFAVDRTSLPPDGPPDYARARRMGRTNSMAVTFSWTVRPRALVRAMVRADKTLFVAGPPHSALRSLLAYEGKQGAVLSVVSASDGKMLVEYGLDSPPVFDGMAAANGRLYLTTQSGRVLCLADARTTSGSHELPELPPRAGGSN